MLGQDAIRSLLLRILSYSTADQTEVVFWGRENNLTRYANSSIHQNVAEADAEVRVRAVVGKKIGVANSRGVFAYHPMSTAEMIALVMSDTGSGYADTSTTDVSQIDAQAIAAEAIDKALRSRDPVAVEPGDYEVVLEEYAVDDILSFLSSMSFSALAVQEGRSFMHLGQQVMGENISIWDDGLSPTGLPMPFDFEGVPKQRVNLIEKGIAKAVVYDTFTAGKNGKASTGHSQPAPNTTGPLPMHLLLEPGTATKEEMVKQNLLGATCVPALRIGRFRFTGATEF
jgi:predicted Zn-dependent protease